MSKGSANPAGDRARPIKQESADRTAGSNTAQDHPGYPRFFSPSTRPLYLADDRRWFRENPDQKIRRRRPIDGEFTSAELKAPPGYRIEVHVEKLIEFTTGDSLRRRWQLLVPLESSLQ